MAIKPRRPLIELQQRMRESGDFRMGRKVKNTSTNKMMPQKLEKWRVTSPDKVALESLAKMYGGEVQPWMDDYGKSTGQFEVYLESNEVIIQLWAEAKSHGYMHWNHDKKMHDRQCDGQDSCWIIERGPKGHVKRQSQCLCNSGTLTSEQDGCKLQTSLQFIVAGLPSLGAWKLTFSGANGYQEFPLSVSSLLKLFGQGSFAVLRLAKRKGPDEKGQIVEYVVPEVDVRANLGEQVKQMGGVSMQSLPGVRLEVIEAGEPPSAAPQLPPLSQPEDVEDEEDERITDESTGEVLGTVTDTARGQSLNGSSTATGEHIAATSAAAVPIDGQVVENPAGESKSGGLTPDALAYLEFCKISVSLDSDHLDEMYDLCADRGYTLSEVLLMAKTMGYKTKTMIKDYMRGLPKKEQTEA